MLNEHHSMKPVKLGVVFDQKIHAGGGYQQALNAALLAGQLPADVAEVVYFTTLKENIQALAGYGIRAVYMRLPWFAKLCVSLRRTVLHPRLLSLTGRAAAHNPFERILVTHGIDLVYFLSPIGGARDLEQLNYIVTVWDLCHRDHPEFPEIRHGREFERREINYRNILPRAVAILADSEHGKANMALRYGVDASRIYVMPFEAAFAARQSSDKAGTDTDMMVTYGLDCPYVYYPAQFQAHKNHVYLLQGLKELELRHNLTVGAIFSGSDLGNAGHIRAYAQQLGLHNRVRFAGFVPNEEVPLLYKQSLALVMPSYFGPTNLPPLEAFHLGVPVLYPDLDGMRDQVADAALLMDLTDPASMAAQLARLIGEQGLRDRLIMAGKARLEAINRTDRLGILLNIVKEFRHKRICWQ